jgi:hypothetical protein
MKTHPQENRIVEYNGEIKSLKDWAADRNTTVALLVAQLRSRSIQQVLGYVSRSAEMIVRYCEACLHGKNLPCQHNRKTCEEKDIYASYNRWLQNNKRL